MVERFRYLYDADELGEWVPRIRQAAGPVKNLHLLMNNCYANYGTSVASFSWGQQVKSGVPSVSSATTSAAEMIRAPSIRCSSVMPRGRGSTEAASSSLSTPFAFAD